MLRRIYFLGLLLLLCIINISFCYDYLSNDELNSKQVNRRTVNRKSRRKFKRRNQAQIDVASFIQSPDRSSLDDSNQSYEQYKQKIGSQVTDDSNFGSYANTNDEINKDTKGYQYYSNIDNVPEVNILHADHFVPQHMNLNGLSMDEIISQNNEPQKVGALTKLDFPYNTKVERSSQKEKKGASLNKIKIPFFSLNKAKEKGEVQEKNTKIKEKKDKKRRRLFGARKQKKQSTITPKVTVPNTNSIVVKSSKATIDADEIFKRSYLEKLCPACKQKFLGNSKSDDKMHKFSNDIIHNSRQYFQRKNNHKAIENDKTCNFEIKSNSLENNVDFENSMKDQRWKRDVDTIEERQKKLLEEIQKKVESVRVNNNQDN